MGIVPGMCLFLSTPSARRATVPCGQVSSCLFISIHALREESDFCLPRRLCRRCYFYPRPPRGERQKSRFFLKKVRNFYPRPPRGERPASVGHASAVSRFLSTPSARRATCCIIVLLFDWHNFYPRPPRGERPAPRPTIANSVLFLSTPSARRATWSTASAGRAMLISIHALREESDQRPARSAAITTYFYPRPPRGERLSLA